MRFIRISAIVIAALMVLSALPITFLENARAGEPDDALDSAQYVYGNWVVDAATVDMDYTWSNEDITMSGGDINVTQGYTLTMNNCNVWMNVATQDEYKIHVQWNSSLVLNNCVIRSNTTESYKFLVNGNLTMTNSAIYNATHVEVKWGTATLTNSLVQGHNGTAGPAGTDGTTGAVPTGGTAGVKGTNGRLGMYFILADGNFTNSQVYGGRGGDGGNAGNAGHRVGADGDGADMGLFNISAAGSEGGGAILLDNSTFWATGSLIQGGPGGNGGFGGRGGDSESTSAPVVYGGDGGRANEGGHGGNAFKTTGENDITILGGSLIKGGDCGLAGQGGDGGDGLTFLANGIAVGGEGGDVERSQPPSGGYAIYVDDPANLTITDSTVWGGNGTKGYSPGTPGSSLSNNAIAFQGATLPVNYDGKFGGSGQDAIYATDSNLIIYSSSINGGIGGDGGDGTPGGPITMNASPSNYALGTAGGKGWNPGSSGRGVYVRNSLLTINATTVMGGDGGTGGRGGDGSFVSNGGAGAWLMGGDGGACQMGGAGAGAAGIYAEGSSAIFVTGNSAIYGGDGGNGGGGGDATDSIGVGGVDSMAGGSPDGGMAGEGAQGGPAFYADSSALGQMTIWLRDSDFYGGDGGDGGIGGLGSSAGDGTRHAGVGGTGGDGGTGSYGARIIHTNPSAPFVKITVDNIMTTGGAGGAGGMSGGWGNGGWNLSMLDFVASGNAGDGNDGLNLVEGNVTIDGSTFYGGDGGVGPNGVDGSDSFYLMGNFGGSAAGSAGNGGNGGNGGDIRLSSVDIVNSFLYGGDGGGAGHAGDGGDGVAATLEGGDGGGGGAGGTGGTAFVLSQSTLTMNVTNATGGDGGMGGDGGDGGSGGIGTMGGNGGAPQGGGAAGTGTSLDRTTFNGTYLTMWGGDGAQGGGGGNAGPPFTNGSANATHSPPAMGSIGGTGLSRTTTEKAHFFFKYSKTYGGKGAIFSGKGGGGTAGGVAFDVAALKPENITVTQCSFTGGKGGNVISAGDGINGTANPVAGNGGSYAVKTSSLGSPGPGSRFLYVDFNGGSPGIDSVGSNNGAYGGGLFTTTSWVLLNNCSISNMSSPGVNATGDSMVDVLNCTFDNSTIFAEDFSQVNVTWYLEVFVHGKAMAPMQSVEVWLNNSLNSPLFNKYTPVNGTFKWIKCLEFIQYLATTGRVSYTPHHLDAWLGDYYLKQLTPLLDHSQKINIKMVPVNKRPIAPTNLLPTTTHNNLPMLSWTHSYDENGDKVTYNVTLAVKAPFSYVFQDLPADGSGFYPSYNVTGTGLTYGETYTFEVWATDVQGLDAMNEAQQDFTVTNVAPTTPAISIAPTLPKTGDQLSAVIDTPSTDIDVNPEDVIHYKYEWYKDDVFQAAVSSVYITDEMHNVTSDKTVKGEVWKVIVTPWDTIEDGLPTQTQVTIINTPPNVAASNPYPATLDMDEDAPLLDTIDLDSVFEDVDADTLVFTYSGDNHLTIDISAENTVDFTPDDNWFGVEVIDFTASDQDADYIGYAYWELTVTVNPINDAPVITAPTADMVATEDIPYEVTLAGEDLLDGDDVTMTLTSQPGDDDIPTWLVDAFDSDTGTISITPTDAHVGVYPVRVTAHDNNGTDDDNYAHLDINFTVENVNDVPVAVIDAPADSTVYTLSQSIDFSGTATDGDLDIPDTEEVLTYKWTSSLDDTLGSDEDLVGIDDLSVGFHTITFKVTDALGDKGTDTIIITVQKVEVPITSLLRPGDGADMKTTDVELAWEVEYEETGDITYIIKLGKDNDLTDSDIVTSGHTTTTYTATGLLDKTTYYWTIIPQVGGLTGNCADGVFSFNVDTGIVTQYGVTVSLDPDSLKLRPGSTGTVNATINNIGTVTDIIVPGIASDDLSAGFSIDKSGEQQSIEAGASKTFTVTVTCPEDAVKDDTFTLTITGTSIGSNSAEVGKATLTITADPEAPITDGEDGEDPKDLLDEDKDGILDAWEKVNGMDPANPADADEDMDEDELTNLQEYLGLDGTPGTGDETDPQKADTDGDGFTDKEERDAGTDPNDINSKPDVKKPKAGGDDNTMMIVAIVLIIVVVVVVILLMVMKKKGAAAKAAESPEAETETPAPEPGPTPGAPQPAPGAPQPAPGAPQPAPGPAPFSPQPQVQPLGGVEQPMLGAGQQPSQ